MALPTIAGITSVKVEPRRDIPRDTPPPNVSSSPSSRVAGGGKVEVGVASRSSCQAAATVSNSGVPFLSLFSIIHVA